MIETHPTAMIQGHWNIVSEKKNRANLPVFAEFLHSFSPLSITTQAIAITCQPFWVAIQWLKTDNMTFFDF